MTYKTLRNLHAERGFFRSSAACAVSGIFAGGSVVLAQAATKPSILESALAAFLSAAAVAIVDHYGRKRQIRAHQDFVEGVHRKTRASVSRPRKRRRKPQS
jgi:hypothetical protein